MQNENNFSSTDIGYEQVTIQRYKNNVISCDDDFVASEVPIAFVFNGISHAVMLATPLNLVDFALGFSFSEGIIDHRSQVFDIEEVAHPESGIEMHLTIANDCFMRLKERRRSMAGKTGCGLCGLESLSAFEESLAMSPIKTSQFIIERAVLFDAFHQLQQAQTINKVTGSMHAAAWVNARGELVLVREDLGRHNALDKLIGALMVEKNEKLENGCVIMTSRASYELVQKTARAGISMLATISAPTTLAIRLASISGLTLIGFVRNHSLVVYTPRHSKTRNVSPFSLEGEG